MSRIKTFIGINQFTGDYKFLSNFYPAKVSMGFKIYPTVEHAYQASKTIQSNERQRILEAKTPGEAKRLGRKVTLREDWEIKKIIFMTKLVERKFKDIELAKKLIATDSEKLIEGNIWHDNFWGDCYCENCHQIEGKNYLGIILMAVRENIKLKLAFGEMEG